MEYQSGGEVMRTPRTSKRSRRPRRGWLVILVAAIGLAAGGCLPVTVSRVPTNRPVVFFTIDDGLVRDPAVINFLRAYRIPVTLFVNPGPVGQDPGYFQSLRSLGNSIQDHTVNHPDLTRLSVDAQKAEICSALDSYQARFGQRPWMLRPPYGSYNLGTRIAASTCGIRFVVLWRATMDNGHLATQGEPLQPGDIILMHFRSDLLHNLQVIYYTALMSGLQPAALSDYLPAR